MSYLPVKEHERSLPQDEEDSINQLEELRGDEQPYPVAVFSLGEVVSIAVGI